MLSVSQESLPNPTHHGLNNVWCALEATQPWKPFPENTPVSMHQCRFSTPPRTKGQCWRRGKRALNASEKTSPPSIPGKRQPLSQPSGSSTSGQSEEHIPRNGKGQVIYQSKRCEQRIVGARDNGRLQGRRDI